MIIYDCTGRPRDAGADQKDSNKHTHGDTHGGGSMSVVGRHLALSVLAQTTCQALHVRRLPPFPMWAAPGMLLPGAGRHTWHAGRGPMRYGMGAQQVSCRLSWKLGQSFIFLRVLCSVVINIVNPTLFATFRPQNFQTASPTQTAKVSIIELPKLYDIPIAKVAALAPPRPAIATPAHV